MRLCGIDPSFKRAGISVFYDGKIEVTNCKGGVEVPSFQAVWSEANRQTSEIVKVIGPYKIDQIISEVPPPQGQYAPGLWCLDTMLFYKLAQEIPIIYNLNPNYLGHVHGKRKYSKTESVILAKEIIATLEEKEGVKTSCGRLCHDEAESFIFLCRLFVINNMFVTSLSKWKGLLSNKEKLLGGL